LVDSFENMHCYQMISSVKSYPSGNKDQIHTYTWL